MTADIDWERLLALLDGDCEVCDELRSRDLLPARGDELQPTHVERARVARTLVRELEVNWAGVEIVLRMREELIATRTQVAEFVVELRRHAKEPPPPDPAGSRVTGSNKH
jgi:hypothetical protein